LFKAFYLFKGPTPLTGAFGDLQAAPVVKGLVALELSLQILKIAGKVCYRLVYSVKSSWRKEA